MPTNTNSNATRSFKVQFSVDISGPSKKKAKGKSSFKLALVSLVFFAAFVSLGFAAYAPETHLWSLVTTGWNEIKPVLVLLLQLLLK